MGLEGCLKAHLQAWRKAVRRAGHLSSRQRSSAVLLTSRQVRWGSPSARLLTPDSPSRKLCKPATDRNPRQEPLPRALQS